MGADGQPVDAQISDGLIVENRKAREMQRVELRERDQRVVWVDGPGPSFMESSKLRSSVSRDGTIGAKIMKVPCGVMAS